MARNPAEPIAEENDLNLRELVAFLEDGPGFRLGLATYDVPETRDTYLERLATTIAGRQICLSRIDFTHSPYEAALLRRLQEHLREHPMPDDSQPAVMVVGLEATIDFHRADGGLFVGGPLVQNANLQRDAFSLLCPVPLVFWLSPFATGAFAQAAPDLWQWRSGSFSFTGSPQSRTEWESNLISLPLADAGGLAFQRKRERIGLLRELLAERELAEDRDSSGNKSRRAHLLMEIGITNDNLCEWKDAIAVYSEALALFDEIDDRASTGQVLANLGVVHSRMGQLNSAIELFERSLKTARDAGNRRIEANVLSNLGLAYFHLGDRVRAIEYPNRSLALARAMGDLHAEEIALATLGTIHLRLGQLVKGTAILEQALSLAREIRDRRIEITVLGNLGIAFAESGSLDKAIEFFNQQLLIARDIGDRSGEGNACGTLGLAYSHLGQWDRAIDLMSQALEIGQSIGDTRTVRSASVLLQEWRNKHQSAVVLPHQ
jgi:tetratricopeptide (TPR) repeat protein